jgi:hypothetical protein
MMPSFSSFLKHPRKESNQLDEQEQKDLGSSVEDGSNGKLQRRATKRDFLRSLLKRSSTRSESNRRSGQFVV